MSREGKRGTGISKIAPRGLRALLSSRPAPFGPAFSSRLSARPPQRSKDAPGQAPPYSARGRRWRFVRAGGSILGACFVSCASQRRFLGPGDLGSVLGGDPIRNRTLGGARGRISPLAPPFFARGARVLLPMCSRITSCLVFFWCRPKLRTRLIQEFSRSTIHPARSSSNRSWNMPCMLLPLFHRSPPLGADRRRSATHRAPSAGFLSYHWALRNRVDRAMTTPPAWSNP